MKAKDLIKNAAKAATPMPSAAALAELKLLIEHNDTCQGTRGRVSAETACELLSSHGFPCARLKLDRVCRAAFGRKTYSTP